MRAGAVALVAGALLCAGSATARRLDVGPGRAFETPSAAAAVAGDGDTVAIAPGEYFDCAVWRADRLTIQGSDAAPGTVITDRACDGKAAFVIRGQGVTLRRLTFARIRVPDGNGAGVRAEGRDLTVQDSHFVNNEVGILAAAPGGFLRIVGSRFTDTGTSREGRQAHAVRADGHDLLRVENSTFEQARSGDHIAAAVRRTELVGNRMVDEGGRMTGPLVSIAGGALLLDGNTVDLAAGAADRPGAVLVTGDAGGILVQGNTLREADGNAVPLVRNWTGQAAAAAGNATPADVAAVSDSGTTYHRLRTWLAELRDWLHGLLARARHVAGVVLRRLT